MNKKSRLFPAGLRRWYWLYLLLQCTWALPQNILGAVLWLFLRGTDCLLRRDRTSPRYHGRFHGSIVTGWGISGSMGLGMFLFCTDPTDVPLLVHEWGHTLQSAVLGPLFLLCIGLPSLLWANLPCLRRYRHKTRCRYCTFYPERWASDWGEKLLQTTALR